MGKQKIDVLMATNHADVYMESFCGLLIVGLRDTKIDSETSGKTINTNLTKDQAKIMVIVLNQFIDQ